MVDTLLKPGDVVKLRGTPSPYMTVDRVWVVRQSDDLHSGINPEPGEGAEETHVRCVWFTPDHSLREGTFNPEALVLA